MPGTESPKYWADVICRTVIKQETSSIIPIEGVFDVNDLKSVVAAIEASAERTKHFVAAHALECSRGDEGSEGEQLDLPKTTVAILRIYPDTGFGEPDVNHPMEWPLSDEDLRRLCPCDEN